MCSGFVEQRYLLICVGTALATFFASENLEGIGVLHESVLWWGDTLGIGAFAVVGAQAAFASGMLPSGHSLSRSVHFFLDSSHSSEKWEINFFAKHCTACLLFV